MLKHSSVSVSVGSLGPGAHKVCLSPLSVSWGGMDQQWTDAGAGALGKVDLGMA